MHDTIIIGAGVAGLAAAMYAGRLQLKTLVMGASSGSEMAVGGVITLTEVVENYPGFKSLSGFELAEKIRDHALEYQEFIGLREEKAAEVRKIPQGCFMVRTDKREYQAKTVIFATGTSWKKLEMKGAGDFEGKGVHYCTLCDGPLFRGKVVAIVGGSDSAVKEALMMSEIAERVYIIFRGDRARAEPVNMRRLEGKKNVESVAGVNLLEIKGRKFVESILLDRPYRGKRELSVDGVFGAIGHIPNSGLAKKLGVRLNGKGEIIINREAETNIKGIFAAGDVADTTFKQAITGVGEAVTAAHSAFRYAKEREFVCPAGDEPA